MRMLDHSVCAFKIFTASAKLLFKEVVLFIFLPIMYEECLFPDNLLNIVITPDPQF